MDMIFIANAISALGAFLLFAGYFEITIRKKEVSGIVLSGLGSLVMCFAFYILDSMAFLTLNVIWMCISIHGYLNRNSKEKELKPVIQHQHLNNTIYALLVIPGSAFVLSSNLDSASWFSILIMLTSYFAFAAKKMERLDYIRFQVVANIISIFHMYDIQNYSSIAQTVISIGISIYAIASSEKSNDDNVITSQD